MEYVECPACRSNKVVNTNIYNRLQKNKIYECLECSIKFDMMNHIIVGDENEFNA